MGKNGIAKILLYITITLSHIGFVVAGGSFIPIRITTDKAGKDN
jgi:hypothetical protein